MKRRYTKHRSTVPISEEGQELLEYDNPSFPCNLVLTDLGKMLGHEVPWHWHDNVEISFITSGSARIYINDGSYELKEGEGYFLNRNVLHAMRLLSDSCCESTTIIFSPGIFSGGIGSKLYQELVLPVLVNTDMDFIRLASDGGGWQAEALGLIDRIRTIYDESGMGKELLICEALARFWYLLTNYGAPGIRPGKPLSSVSRVRIKQMIAYIEKHFAEPITLEEIAAAAGISRRECTRCFQRVVGESPTRYLTQLRIKTAAARLRDQSRDVTSVAAEVGLDNLSYFAKIFRRHMGMTPKAYQKKHDTSGP